MRASSVTVRLRTALPVRDWAWWRLPGLLRIYIGAVPAAALALIVLAAGSVLAGYAGVPRALGGADRFERFLEPSFRAGGVARAAADVEEESSATATATEGLELGLMAVSIVAAIGGIGIATFFFLMKKRAADEMAERFAGVHRVLANKYYVDEIYGATVVRGSLLFSRVLYWLDQNVIDAIVNLMSLIARTVAYIDAAIDKYIVDGAVNGLGNLTWNSGRALRRLQTGHIQAYLYGALGGAIVFVIIQYVIR